MANVLICISSATGMLKVKKDQTSRKFLLDKKKVRYVEKDVATDSDARVEMKTASGKTVLPPALRRRRVHRHLRRCPGARREG
ncbi:hypothetical protein ACOT81_20970 [Streptomyces sp. WI04-05B]|uniref:hypothetical protein n=1 Tax=Streptomyces TaxID=1883 RepID=UPI0029A30C29|nr:MULTISPECIES: hypothetical protein [unclassified Streptomyces]MDX2544093.1 hypothetical protein [Streptomyces sp. WI04-05B]MDX2584509.1 hypothetical protein [Streptomyces sp. WI04-05A]